MRQNRIDRARDRVKMKHGYDGYTIELDGKPLGVVLNSPQTANAVNTWLLSALEDIEDAVTTKLTKGGYG